METPLNSVLTEQFCAEIPYLRDHFLEFRTNPAPTVVARASHISNIAGINVGELCEAAQMATYEHFQIMNESMMENYPVTTGVLPWSFAEKLPAVSYQFVDGYKNPCWNYYALCKTYERTHPFAALPHLNYRTGETIHIPLKIFSEQEYSGKQEFTFELLNGRFESVLREKLDITEYGKGPKEVGCIDFVIPSDWNDVYFFVRVQLWEHGMLVGESTYFPKVLSAFNDDEVYQKERANPCVNRYFDKGPWLKAQIQQGPQASLACETLETMDQGDCFRKQRIRITNTSSVPAYPVVIGTADDMARLWCSDNIFMLMGGESREVDVLVDMQDAKTDDLHIRAWNASVQPQSFDDHR